MAQKSLSRTPHQVALEAVQSKEANMSDANVGIVTDSSLLDMEAKLDTKPAMPDQANETAQVLPARVLIREL